MAGSFDPRGRPSAGCYGATARPRRSRWRRTRWTTLRSPDTASGRRRGAQRRTPHAEGAIPNNFLADRHRPAGESPYETLPAGQRPHPAALLL